MILVVVVLEEVFQTTNSINDPFVPRSHPFQIKFIIIFYGLILLSHLRKTKKIPYTVCVCVKTLIILLHKNFHG